MCLGGVWPQCEGCLRNRDSFWDDLDRILDRVGNGCRLCIRSEWKGITGAIGVLENIIMEKLVEFYVKREVMHR